MVIRVFSQHLRFQKHNEILELVFFSQLRLPISNFTRELQLIYAIDENRLELINVSCMIKKNNKKQKTENKYLPQSRGKRKPQLEC